MTFADKLKKFKSERVGFKVETEEIAKGLCEVFQMEGLRSCEGSDAVEFMKKAFGCYKSDVYVSANYPGNTLKLAYGLCNSTGMDLDSIFPITSQELQRYLKIRKGIQENPEVYFPTPTREIYDELMNTLDSLGCRWLSYDSPMEYDGFSSDHKICVKYSNVITLDGRNVGCGPIVSLTSEPPTPSQTITIVSDGYHKVTAESNGITAEAIYCPTDTFSIAKGTHMALQRLLEKQKEADVIQELDDLTDEEHKFHKGDIVEVLVGGEGGTPKESKGIQGIVQQDNCACPYVKLMTTFGGLDTYAYLESELKLIRKNPCE